MTDERALQNALAAIDAASTSTELRIATGELVRCRHLDAVPKLMEVIGYNNPSLANLAVSGLISLGAAAAPLILKQLDPSNYGARAWAVRALAEIGDICGLTTLEQAITNDIGPSVRRAAAKGLGIVRLSSDPGKAEKERSRCLYALCQACSDSEWVVRYAAAFGLEHRLKNVSRPEQLCSSGERALQQLSGESEGVRIVRLRAHLALQRLHL